MKNTLITLASVAALAGAANAQTITNGSFENPLGTGNPFHAIGSNYFTGWTDGGTGTYQSVTSIAGTDGNQWLDLEAGGLPSIEQSFATLAGTTYTLTFDRGVYGSEPSDLDNSLQLEVGNLNVTDTATATASGMNWINRSYNFTASGTTTTLKFTHISGDGGLLNGVDNVVVTPVPEPSSTALLGLGALGLLVRRKRSV